MEEERQKKTLRVTVLDRDRIGSDFLGETRVALRKLPLSQTKKFNLYLEHVMAAPVRFLQFLNINNKVCLVRKSRGVGTRKNSCCNLLQYSAGIPVCAHQTLCRVVGHGQQWSF